MSLHDVGRQMMLRGGGGGGGCWGIFTFKESRPTHSFSGQQQNVGGFLGGSEFGVGRGVSACRETEMLADFKSSYGNEM